MALLKKRRLEKDTEKKAARAKGAKEEVVKEGRPPKKRRLKKDPETAKAKQRAEEDAALAGQDAAGAAAAAAAAEEKRKDAGRQIQALVRKLREEGKSEKKITTAKRELKKKLGVVRKGKKVIKSKEWLKSEAREAERKRNLDRMHDLVIIPVVWRSRHDANDLLSAAQDIKECLAREGVDVWVDKRRKYAPGQKFAFWEYKGVMLRVEIGPKDLEAGICRVCLAKTAGDYQSVERRSVRLPPAGTRALLLALKDLGLSKIDIERRPGEEEDQVEVPEAAKAKEDAQPAAPRGDDDVEGNVAAPPPKELKEKLKRGKKRKAVK
mmetsp:Transcript_11030/g.25924  ORF Transcript_11030/g.25924 Transcript_11030/m.25924 type:complete len:323 (+) Transcript_11030:178-1146(+)